MGGGSSTKNSKPQPKEAREVQVAPPDDKTTQHAECKSGVLLDCGSGHTSVLWYSQTEGNSQIRQLRRSKLKLPRGGNLKVGWVNKQLPVQAGWQRNLTMHCAMNLTDAPIFTTDHRLLRSSQCRRQTGGPGRIARTQCQILSCRDML